MSTKATTLNSKKSVGALVKDWMSLVGIAILIVVFSIISYVKFGAQYFLTWSNWKNILLQSSTVAIVALGQSIMLLTGNFDLSLGRMVCLTSCVGAILMKNVGMSTGLAILIMFAIGLAVGAVNGFMVSYVGVPAMIATLGTQYICYGLAKLITQAVPIPNMPEGILFQSEDYKGTKQADRSDAACIKLPMAVLVNQDSYSAAEFFAAAIQEYNWGTVVGTKTVGKGNFQTAFTLSDGSMLNLSIGKYYTPQGRSLTDTGITPDVEIALSDEDGAKLYYGQLEKADDAQLQAAIREITQKLS